VRWWTFSPRIDRAFAFQGAPLGRNLPLFVETSSCCISTP
jgi:hypothetical protein